VVFILLNQSWHLRSLPFIFLPIKKNGVAVSHAGRTEPTASGSGEVVERVDRVTVLIVDEDIKFADDLSHALSARGFVLLVANDQKNALLKFLEERPDIVILSYGIKEVGPDLTKELLHVNSGTKVIILTDSHSKINEQDERLGVEIFMQRDAGVEKITDMVFVISNLKKSPCNFVAR
jgi:ActR/RegA family two-component response regulator